LGLQNGGASGAAVFCCVRGNPVAVTKPRYAGD